MNMITGSAGNDSLTGSINSDYLDGGAGADTMAGMAGDDVYVVDNQNDVVIENLDEGIDRVNSTVSYSLSANVENLWLVGSADTSGFGNELSNTLWANSGKNLLVGGAGNDYIDGGAGADTLIGGAGDDTYWVDNTGDVVSENAGEGKDTVYSSLADYTLTADVENLSLVPAAGNIHGTGNELDNYLTGNNGNNLLDAKVGNDSLDGGVGADTMIGGVGNDTYWVDDVGDVVIENTAEGADTVISTLADYTLPSNVEDLRLGTFYGSAGNLNGIGNELGNMLRGNCGNNILIGGAGDDTLVGGDGNDTLTGGDGNDVYYISSSDSGMDTITDLSSGDVIEVCAGFNLTGSVTEGDGTSVHSGEVQLATSGNQSILYVGVDDIAGPDVTVALNGTFSVSDFHSSGFEIRYDTNHAPVLDNPIGDQYAREDSAYTHHLSANTFTDIDGDTLTYSAVQLDADWGLVALPSWLGFDAATGTLSGTPAHDDVGSITVMVTATDPKGEIASDAFSLTVRQASISLTGGAGNDCLEGAEGNDSLDGADGDDSLCGYLGRDTIIGGLGDDNLRGGNQADWLNGGEGSDLVSGGNGDDYLAGGDGDDTLIGADGCDTLDGGDGNDNLSGGLKADILTGGLGDDQLAGGQGMDTLDGGAGNDTLLGGFGTDVLTGGAGADHFVFGSVLDGLFNIDTVTDFQSGTDVIDLSAAVFTAYSGQIGSTLGLDTHLVYTAGTGTLAYDADGAGAGSPVTFAILGTSSHPAMLGNDFKIVA